jgi:two-component system, LytTR family, response regulator
MSIKAILVDDETVPLNALKRELLLFKDRIEITGAYTSPETARQEILKQKPDVVFLDIEMGRTSGIELARMIKPVCPNIVFVTGYLNYTGDAYMLNVICYLVKTNIRQLLPKVIADIELRLDTKVQNSLWIRNIEVKKNQERIRPHETSQYKVAWQDVICIQKKQKPDSDFLDIYVHSGKKFTERRPLSYYQELLDEEPSSVRSLFWLINEYTLVNHLFIGALVTKKVKKGLNLLKPRYIHLLKPVDGTILPDLEWLVSEKKLPLVRNKAISYRSAEK